MSDNSLKNVDDIETLLGEADLKELRELASEPISENTISLDEFNRIMDQGRNKNMNPISATTVS